MSGKNLEEMIDSSIYSGFKRTLLIGIITLTFLGALILGPKKEEVKNQDFTLKKSTYSSVTTNEERWIDLIYKEEVYTGINKTVEERIKFKEYLNSKEPYECLLPEDMAGNKFYYNWISNITRGEFGKYNPKLKDKADFFVETCIKERVNPLLVLLMYKQESSYGTKGVARVTNSIGNERGIGPAGSYYGFAAYHNMNEALEATIKNMKRLISSGYNSIGKLISKWAPNTENDTTRYINSLIMGIHEQVNEGRRRMR